MLPRLHTRRSISSRSSISSCSSDSSPTRSINGFLESPPLSPTLPSILPRHGKKQPPRRLRNGLRLLVRKLPWIFGTIALVWLVFIIIETAKDRFNVHYVSHSQKDDAYRIVGAYQLPEDPTPVVLMDLRGRSRWTVHIPETHRFPPEPDVLTDLCSESEALVAHLSESKSHSRFFLRKKTSSYYHVDNSFIDVKDAEDRGLLPKSSRRPGIAVGFPAASNQTNATEPTRTGEICSKSLTYVLETTEAGLGNTLLGLWTAYGLALSEQRAFFIDDRHWAYGNYTTFFQPPPKPTCLPPPETQRIPCPRHAAHLLVSQSTFQNTFGQAFQSQINLKQQFRFLRTGYEALFHLAKPDSQYLGTRLQKIKEDITDAGGNVIAIHIRHGDRHPWEYQYQHSYIPLIKYYNAATSLADTLATSANGTLSSKHLAASRWILASDDPDVYTSTEFKDAMHAQDQFVMASKSQLDAAQKQKKKVAPQRSQQQRFKSENTGWEGGFFKDVFWGLARPVKGMKASEKKAAEETGLQLRGLIGRAYILDLAVLGVAVAPRQDESGLAREWNSAKGVDVHGLKGGVVCGVSSATCRLLGVMMGWDAVMGGKGGKGKRWVNVDGPSGWKGIVVDES